MGPTVFLTAVRLYDCMIATNQAPAYLHQLIAMAILWSVNKLDTGSTMGATKLLKCSGCTSYTPEELLQMEIKMLVIFDCNYLLPDPITFVCYYLRLLRQDFNFKVSSTENQEQITLNNFLGISCLRFIYFRIICFTSGFFVVSAIVSSGCSHISFCSYYRSAFFSLGRFAATLSRLLQQPRDSKFENPHGPCGKRTTNSQLSMYSSVLKIFHS